MEENCLKLLAIDDNKDNLTTLNAMLMDVLPACKQLTALSGPQGIRLAEAEDPDVILLDIVMPGMDGFEVCRQLKADENLCSIPVVFLTALRADSNSRIMALEVGGEGFLTKPLDEAELLAQIRAMAKINTANRLQRLEKNELAELVAERTQVLERELAERKRVEEALRESEERYRTFIESTSDMVFLKDAKFRHIVANKAMAAFFGKPIEQIMGLSDAELMPAHAGETCRASDQRAVDTGKVFVSEESIGDRVFETLKFPVPLQDGQVGVGGYIRDITERKLAERRQRLFAQILGILNEPLAMTDTICRILGAIKLDTGFDAVGLRLQDGDDYPHFAQEGFSDDFIAAENTLVIPDKNGGICRDEDGSICLECTCGLVVSGKTDPTNALFTPGGSAWTNNSLPLLEIPADQEPRLNPRNRCVHEGFLSVALIPIRVDQEIVGILQLNDRRAGRLSLEMVQHIEEIGASIGLGLTQEQAREKLVISEGRYRRLFESAKDGILILDAETGMIVDVNPFLTEMLGCSREELLQKAVWDIGFLSDVVASRNSFLELQQNEYIRYEDMPLRTADGRQIDVEFVSNVYLVDHRKVIQCDIRDITERKKAQDEVCRLNSVLEQLVAQRTSQLEAANRELEAFASAVSHDLRAPIIRISGMSQALMEDYGEDLDEQGNGFLRRVQSEAKRMGSLVDDLLKLSRVSNSDLHTHKVNLSSLASTVAGRVKQSQPDRDIEWVIEPGISALGDSHLLQVVLENLLGNAAKFTSKSESARAEFGKATVNGRSAFYVKDNGAGFDMAYAYKLFAPFQRLHADSDYPGTGVGLSTVQRIVRRHGGEVWANARVDEGATFFFTLGEMGIVHNEEA